MTQAPGTTSPAPTDPGPPAALPTAPSGSAANTALLLEFLQATDAPCPLCKYNLRNLRTPRCPECGRDIKLTVGLVEQNIRWYIVLLVAVLLPVGMGLVGWIGFCQEGFRIYRYSALLETVAIVGFQASPIPAFFALILRRRFLRLDPSFQRLLAILALAEPLLLYGILIATIIFMT